MIIENIPKMVIDLLLAGYIPRKTNFIPFNRIDFLRDADIIINEYLCEKYVTEGRNIINEYRRVK